MNGKFGIMAAAGLAALALAGCGSKDDAKDGAPKSIEQVKKEADKLVKPEPGEYRQVMEIKSLEVPGMPKEAAEQMKGAMKASQEGTFCLTKADADRGFKDMFNDVGKGNQCTYSKFDVDGGALDAQMECQSQQAGKAVMKMKGTVTEKGSDVTVAMDTNGGPPPMGTMKMTMHMTTTRLGDCKAK
ncbi:DUF3617 domain-containing protein [Novosphingobium sp. P6W]|uniref:DUF3617 domain-containing protein n=1 Tax=Novosphingobium sp. P6W TaxID=1609758 RepID=UPI0005C31F76|nr:DUF3617 domain-containing protein [Novosphingobium sp. P6W]AXB75741.1 DUF3617 domain-containing protein [Novosphingobium sp. P6W]KIS33044.1 hypothetical protein TQ38_06115 [Novosphingobium sp. P6W]